MNAVERVEERIQRAMEGLLREFEADETEPVDCAFYVIMEHGAVKIQDLIVVGTTLTNADLDELRRDRFPVDADSSGNGVPDDAPEKPKVVKRK